MNKVHIFAALVAAAVLPTRLLAQDGIHPVSQAIATQGLAAVEENLSAQTTRTAQEQFALGAVQFLGTVEEALQTRWQHNIGADASSLPIMRLGLEPNPEAAAYEPAMVAALFDNVLTGMAEADATLAAVELTPDLALTIDLADLWFDINGNSTRDPGEGLDVALRALPAEEGVGSVVTFDQADVPWLRAYTQLISTTSAAVLAFDPTEPLTRIREADSQILERSGASQFGWPMGAERGWLSYFAVVLETLDQQPDRAHLSAAAEHLRAMLTHNATFWTLVATETDDAQEWIPNDRQTSALGLPFPPGVGDGWQAVLRDVEAVLEGELLIPHPLLPPQIGIDLSLYLAEPRPIDVAGWIHGHDALPYLRRGPLIDGRSWDQFSRLVGRRNGLLFAVVLN